MRIENFKIKVSEKLSERDYFGMYKLIDEMSEDYLKNAIDDYSLCTELITMNQDLLEYMSASKQYEMAFDLIKKN